MLSRSSAYLLILVSLMFALPAFADSNHGTTLNGLARQFLFEHPEARALGYTQWGGSREAVPKPVTFSGDMVSDSPWWTNFPPVPAKSATWKMPSKMARDYVVDAANSAGATTGNLSSDAQLAAQTGVAAEFTANAINFPLDAAQQAAAQQQAQAIAAGNAAGDTAKNQAASALDHCSKFLVNFTSTAGNKWNQIRDSIFVPIGLLLLLPGAVLTQVKCIASAGNPVLGNVNPFEGILRAFVAIFFIPASYLIVNYGIDFSNCITLTIATEYSRMFGSNMYRDAMCAQIRAFNTRTPAENQGAGEAQDYPTPDVHDTASWEDAHASKTDDPCAGIYDAPANRTDQGMPASVAAGRMITYGANAALTATWNILCAFQMAYLYYLFFAGPVVAGLWVWPTKQLRDAFPNWVEGVITLCFWSLFWNTTVLLMACFRGVDDTGTLIMTALNFLSTSCVKFAFDFSGLVKAAGQEAAKKATEGNKGAGGGGSGGGQGAGAQGAGARGAKPSSHLPADYHVTGLGSDGLIHATNAAGNSMSFDAQTGMWNPDVATTGPNGTTVEGGLMDSGEGGDSISSLSAGTVKPVGVDIDLPPLSTGSIDTLLPDGNRLQVWSDNDGKHFAVTTPEGNAILASGDIAPGANAVQFDIQNADGTENPAVLSITDDPTTMTDTFTFSSPTGTESAMFKTNEDGSEQVRLSENGNVVADYTLGAAGTDNGLQYSCANGDTLLVSDLGNGMSAYSRIDSSGAVDTIVAPTNSPVTFGEGGPVVSSTMNSDGSSTLSVDHGNGYTEQFVMTDTAAGDHVDYSNSSGMQLSSDISSTVTADGTNYSVAFTGADGTPIGTEIGSVTYDQNGQAMENREFLDVNGIVIGTGFSNGSEQTDTVYTPAGREERTFDSASGATITSEYNQQGVLADQHFDYQNGVSEDRVYTADGGYNSTVLAPDGQTVISTSSATMNADNTQTYSSTAYSYDSTGHMVSNDTTAHYAQSGALIDSATVMHDAAGNSIGNIHVSQNGEGGYTAIQTDTSGHVVSSETTSYNAATGVMVDSTTSMSYDASGNQSGSTVVTTSTGSDGQLLSQTSSAYVRSGNTDVLTQSQDIHQTNGVWTATNTSYEGGSAVTTSSSVIPQGQETYTASQSYSDNGTVQSIATNDPASGASGWMSYDSLSHTYSAGTSGVAQPEITISFADGQQAIDVNGTVVKIPENYQEGTSIPIDSVGSTVTIANTQFGETVTVHRAGQTYSVSEGQMVVNGTVGSFAGWRNLTGRRATPTNIPALAAVGSAPIKAPTGGPGDGGTNSNNGAANQGEPTDEASLLMKEGMSEEDHAEMQALEDFDAGTEADALYTPGIQSLERQMMDASNHATRPGQLNSLLRTASAHHVNNLPDAIVAATVDQNMATLMAGQGHYAQADQLYRNALNVMENFSESDEYRILLETYANYLSRRGREYEANEYRSRIVSQFAGPSREVVRI